MQSGKLSMPNKSGLWHSLLACQIFFCGVPLRRRFAADEPCDCHHDECLRRGAVQGGAATHAAKSAARVLLPEHGAVDTRPEARGAHVPPAPDRKPVHAAPRVTRCDDKIPIQL